MTPQDVLDSLPPERAKEVAAVRKAIRKALPKGYEEVGIKGFIVYQVPLSVYPDTYNKKAMWLCALGAPKSYLTLHFLPAYMNKSVLKKLEDGFRKAKKKLTMGKGCINYQKADDLALGVIGDIIAGLAVDDWVATAKAARAARRSSPLDRR